MMMGNGTHFVEMYGAFFFALFSFLCFVYCLFVYCLCVVLWRRKGGGQGADLPSHPIPQTLKKQMTEDFSHHMIKLNLRLGVCFFCCCFHFFTARSTHRFRNWIIYEQFLYLLFGLSVKANVVRYALPCTFLLPLHARQ